LKFRLIVSVSGKVTCSVGQDRRRPLELLIAE
jgi:hypothetical protein